MKNPTTGERSPFSVVIVTSGNDGNYAAASVGHSDDSGLERTACAKSENLLDAVMNCAKVALGPNITGNWLNITLTTDSDYLVEMFGGKYREMEKAGEEIDHKEIWAEIDRHLRAHHCKIIACTKLGDMTEVAARAKATAEYYAPTAGLWTAVKPAKKRQPRKKAAEADVA